jgi:hypothetical protein
MWERLSPQRFHVLRSVVQVEIDQDRVDAGLRVLSHDLSSYHLDAPNACTTQLTLPRRPRRYHLLCFDVRLELRRKLDAVENGKSNWDSVVRKHGELINVVEFAERLAIEAGPEVYSRQLLHDKPRRRERDGERELNPQLVSARVCRSSLVDPQRHVRPGSTETRRRA